MKNNNQIRNLLIIFGVIIVLAFGYSYYDKQQPGKLDTFAQCLTEKNAKFYGAFWCPHCQSQKALFGKSKDKLSYVECSTPDGKSQTEECKTKGVTSYPSWEFASTTSTSTELVAGELTLLELSGKTGCQLP